MRWTGGEKMLVAVAVLVLVFAVQYGCSKREPAVSLKPATEAVAPVTESLKPATEPAKQPNTIVPKAPEAPAITATSAQAQPAKQSAEKTTTVVLNPVKVAIKQPSRNRQANGEAAAYAKAEANKRRAFCLKWLVDWKAEKDIKAGSISDLGNVRAAEPALCQLVVDLYYKK